LHSVVSGIAVAQDRARDAPERAEPRAIQSFDVLQWDGLTLGHWEDDAPAHAFLYRANDV
jgi:hypothetical protein